MSNLNDDVETIEEAQFRLEERKWRHRRDLAKKSFYLMAAIILATFALLFIGDGSIIDRMSSVSEVFVMGLISLTSIVGFYFGATTYADIKRK